MTIGIGVGLAEFPFSSATAFWRWIALCEAGGVDSFWQTDRLVSTIAFLETMSAMAAVAGATERMKFGMNVASVGLPEEFWVVVTIGIMNQHSTGLSSSRLNVKCRQNL